MSLDPAAFPRSPKDLGRWQKWVEDRLKYLASGRGLIERASVAGGVVTVREILTNPTGPIQFTNTDTGTCPADGADIPIPLSHIPKPGSEQVFYNGLPLKRVDWSRTETLLTIPGESWFRAGKVAWVDYAYDATIPVPEPVILTPANASSTTDNTPTVTGTGAGGYTLDVFIDGVSVGTTTVDAGGTWSLTPSALTIGLHTAYAVQHSPDGSLVKSNTVSFSVTLIPASFVSVSWVQGNATSLPLPTPAAGTTGAGDMLVLAIAAGGGPACSDPRMTLKGTVTAPTFSLPTGGIWVGTDDGSGTPLSISSPSTDGNSVAAVMRIHGSPLLPVTSEATTIQPSGPATFTPTVPSGGSFGVVAIASGVGLISSTIHDDELGNWTTESLHGGAGSGKTSVYLGIHPGGPVAGQWSQFGSDPVFIGWMGGLQ